MITINRKICFKPTLRVLPIGFGFGFTAQATRFIAAMAEFETALIAYRF